MIMARKLYETYAYVNIVLCAMGIYINSVFIHALRKLKKLNKAPFRFFLCLSISDCLFCMLEIPCQWLSWDHQLNLSLLFQILLAIWDFCWFLSPIFMLLIAFDRLIHMKNLQQYQAIMTKKRSYIMIVIAIIIALQISVSTILFFHLSSKHWSALSIYQHVVISLLLVMSSIILILYTWTYIRVKKRVADSTNFQSSSGQGNVSNTNNTEEDRAADPAPSTARAQDDNVARAMISVLIFFVLFCYPDIILRLVWLVYSEIETESLSVMFDAKLAYTRPAYILNCSMNAILLMYFCPDIRRYLPRVVRCLKKTNRRNSNRVRSLENQSDTNDDDAESQGTASYGEMSLDDDPCDYE